MANHHSIPDSEYEETSEEDDDVKDSEDGDVGVWEATNGATVTIDDSDADAWSTEPEDVGNENDIDMDADQFIGNDTEASLVKSDHRSTTSTDKVEELTHPPDSPTSVPESARFPTATTVPQLRQHEPPIFTRTPATPSSFEVLETSPPESTPYLNPPPPSLSTQLLKRITREHKILSTSLPDGIFVRTWESRLDILRVLIVGPLGTPYEFAPFLVDMWLPPTYPQVPPEAFFHSWTSGQGPVNPNLYENGKICLSLLGTWYADEKGENWSPARSTILQVLVSIMGLVLVKEPYFNEAGYEVRAGLADAAVPSALYSERTYFRSRGFIRHALSRQVHGFQDVLHWLYIAMEPGAPRLLDRTVEAAKEVLQCGSGAGGVRRGGLTRMSKGALVMLERELRAIEETKATLENVPGLEMKTV